jgi:hypothetical protein
VIAPLDRLFAPVGRPGYRGGMPAPKGDSDSDTAPPLNREQRRREKFGHGARTDHRSPDDAWPVQEANPAFVSAGDDAETNAARPDEDETPKAGPSAAGATEPAGPVSRPAGTPAKNSAKG